MVSQFVDVDAAIGEDSAIAVDEANFGCGGDNTFKPFGGLCCADTRHESLAVPGFGLDLGCRSPRGGCASTQPMVIPEIQTTFQAPKVTSGAYFQDINLAVL